MNLEAETRKKRIGLKVISVVLAVLLWIYVVNHGAVSGRQDIIKTEIKYRNLGSGLTVSGPETVSVRLWGTLENRGDIIAYVDLKDLGEGAYELPVNVERVKGIMLTSVEPDKVQVVIKEIKERKIPITYELTQSLPAGYEMLDIVINPEYCLIKGEEKAVQQVKSVICPAAFQNQGGISMSFGSLSARDTQGRAITEGIRLVPEKVMVYTVLGQKNDVKKVKTKPIITGIPAEGFQVARVEAEPDIIDILGTAGRLAEINELTTKPIDINGSQESFIQEIELVVPANLKVYPSQVLVSIEIMKIPEKGGGGQE